MELALGGGVWLGEERELGGTTTIRARTSRVFSSESFLAGAAKLHWAWA